MRNRKIKALWVVATSATLCLAWFTMSKGIAASKDKTANVCFQSLVDAIEPDSFLYVGIDSDTNDTVLIGCSENQGTLVDPDCTTSVALPAVCEIR